MEKSNNGDPGERPAGEYEVGYGRPPKETRFAKGRSGNPRGRPKMEMTPYDVAAEELSRLLSVTENGQRRKAPTCKAMFRRAASEALKGSLGHMKLLLQYGTNQLDTDARWREEAEDAKASLLRKLDSMSAKMDRSKAELERKPEPQPST